MTGGSLPRSATWPTYLWQLSCPPPLLASLTTPGVRTVRTPTRLNLPVPAMLKSGQG
jgi:hypothetical protein